MQIRLVIGSALVSLFLLVNAQAFPTKPNSSTPGTVCTKADLDFSEFKYPSKIPYCERNVAVQLKEIIYKKYNIPVECRSRYTIDHLIPLSIGGNNGPNNLWPEHVLIKQTRPNLEFELYQALAANEISQKSAIQKIIYEKTHPKWPANFLNYRSSNPCDQKYGVKVLLNPL